METGEQQRSFRLLLYLIFRINDVLNKMIIGFVVVVVVVVCGVWAINNNKLNVVVIDPTTI